MLHSLQRNTLLSLLLPAIALAAPIRYTIDLHDGAVEVKARFPRAIDKAVTFRLRSWAGTDFDRDVESVAAADLRGVPLPVERKDAAEWVVRNNQRGFQLTWRVRSGKDAMIGRDSSSQFHVTVLKDWASIWGHAFLLIPNSKALSQQPVAVRMETHEYGKWDSTLPPNGVVPHLGDLPDQLFIAGAFRSSREAGRRYYFSTSQAVVTDRDLMDAVDKIFLAQTRYMGRPPSRAPLLVFTDGRADSNGGTVVRNSAIFYPNLTVNLKERNAGALRLIGHELFHLWNGGDFHHAHDAQWSDGRYGWFGEGFTEYYSGATLYREKIFDASEFATFLNGLIREYVQNKEALRSTIEDLGSKEWRDRDHTRLSYAKGALLGLLMDMQLRAKKHTLDDYMRAVFRKPTFDLADLRSAWIGLAGESGELFWDKYVVTAAALPFAKSFGAAGIEFEEAEAPIFDLGFTFDHPLLDKGAKILTVAPGSNAEKAGMTPGDSIAGLSVYNGDVTKQAKFNLLRGEERVNVAYIPSTPKRLIQVTGGLEILR